MVSRRVARGAVRLRAATKTGMSGYDVDDDQLQLLLSSHMALLALCPAMPMATPGEAATVYAMFVPPEAMRVSSVMLLTRSALGE